MAQQLELLLKAKNLSDAAFKAVEANIKEMDGSAKKNQSGMKKWAADNEKSIRAVGQAFAALAAVGAAALVAIGVGLFKIGKRSLEAASDAEESENLFTVSFGKMAAAARDWSVEVSDAVGSNEFALRENAATLFNMIDNMGVAEDSAFDMATSLTELAGDMASFYNLPHEQAFQKIQAGISGESEPLKRLGIIVTETAIKHVALQHGLIGVGETMTEAVKVQARYLAIMEQTTKAQGDLAATLDSPTNMIRIQSERIEELTIKIGQALMPAYKGWLTATGDLVNWLGKNEDALIGLVEKGMLIFADALQSVIFAVRLAIDTFFALRKGITFVGLGFDLAANQFRLFKEIIKDPFNADALSQQAAQVSKDLVAAAAETVAGFTAQNETLEEAALAVGRAVNSIRGLVGAEDEATDASEDFAEAMEEVAGITEAAAKAAAKLAKELKAVKAEEAAASYELMADELKAFNDEVKAAADADLAQLADEAATSYNLMADELRGVKDDTKDWGRALQGISLIVGGDLASMVGVIGNIGQAFKDATTDAEKFSAIVSGIGQIGGQIGGKTGGAIQGAAGGAQLGFAVGGPYGAAIGAVVGGIASLVKGSQAAEIATNDLRDAWFEAAGGFVAVQESLLGLTDQDLVAAIFRADTVEEFNAAISEVNALLGLQGQAQADLADAVDRYGFSIEELGPKFQQQELDKMVGGLLKDYELLVASGIDVNTVIEKMGPNFQEYVDTALAAGASLPESMRPVIEAMIEQVALLDENGDAFTSVEESGLSFTETLTDGLSRVIESIEQLVAALTGIPPVVIPVTYTETNRPPGVPQSGGQASEIPGAARGAVVLPFRPRGAAAGDLVQPRAGGVLMNVGEGGDAEVIAPVKALFGQLADQIASKVAGAVSGGGQRIVLELDGQVIADVVVRRNRAGLIPIRESSVRKF